MENEFRTWLTMMFYENCLEREEDGVTPFEDVEAYFLKNHTWLQEKYREKIE